MNPMPPAPPPPVASEAGPANGGSNGSRRAGYDRVPPHSLEAEVSVLGAALLSRNAANEVVEILRPGDFYRTAHRVVFEGVQELMSRGEPCDAVTLLDWLARNGRLDEVGGANSVHDLTAAVPTAANAVHYARIVREKALLRRVIDAGTEIAQLGYESPDDAGSVLDQAEGIVYEIAQSGTSSDYAQLKDLLNESFEQIEKLAENRSEITGLATGFDDLDRLTAGLQPQNLVIVAARPAMGKCLTRSSRVLTAGDGRWVPIGELVEEGLAGKPIETLSLDADRSLVRTVPTAFHDNGVRETFRLETRLGRRTTATANHPFLTSSGWVPLSELRPGDLVAVPRRLAVFGDDPLSDAEVEMLAYLLGHRGTVGDHLPKVDHLTAWFRELGLWGEDRHARFVPERVFRLPKDQVAVFLSRLFATGGSAWVAEGHGSFGISYRSVSEQLIRDVQHLLLRFGIIARIRQEQVEHVVDGEETRRLAYELEIRDAGNCRRFIEEIGIFSQEDQCAAVTAALEAGNVEHTDTDLLPLEIWELILAEKGDRSWADVSAATGRPRNHDWHVGERRPSRRLAAELAEALDSDRLRAWAHSDVYWDEVVSIEEHGEERVYDLTIPELHNFVADDIIVHNSSLSLNLAQYVTVETRQPAIIFSLEMSKIEIVNRMLASEARIDSNRIKTGRLEDADWRKLGDALGRLSDAPLFIDDTPSITLMEIRSKCRRLKAKHGLELIIVDYLQLMQSHRRVENRQQEVSEISRGLKMLAKELDVPVIALSQLSRQPEARTDKRPQLADLRESGSLEQDADIVAFIYRDEVYDEDSPDKGIAELIISKHRNGATGIVKLAFLNHLTKFANLARGAAAGAGRGAGPGPGAPPPDVTPV